MAVNPHDDATISNDGLLIRRIDPAQHVVVDDNLKCRRISSKAYKPSSEPNGGMSVDVKALMDKAGVDAKLFVTNPKQIGSVAFKVDVARGVALRVGLNQLPSNPYHGEVWGNTRANKFSGAQEKALMAASQWFVEIPGVQIIS